MKRQSGSSGPLMTVDVAHPPLPQERVEQLLNDTLSSVKNSSHVRVLKIIHGYGSSGSGGRTKMVVLNWTYKNRSRLRSVIKGEDYTLANRVVREIRLEVGPYSDPDLASPNPGVTICWVK